jgi:hypothetical protein
MGKHNSELKIISHRGNINGPNKIRENVIPYIVECIEKYSLDVEIDLRFQNNQLYLTHDELFTEENKITDLTFLQQYKDHLWLHCKDFETLIYANNTLIDFNYFGHCNDPFVLTSKKYIFTSPGNLTGDRVVCVMPELVTKSLNFSSYCAVLTDYPLNFI